MIAVTNSSKVISFYIRIKMMIDVLSIQRFNMHQKMISISLIKHNMNVNLAY